MKNTPDDALDHSATSTGICIMIPKMTEGIDAQINIWAATGKKVCVFSWGARNRPAEPMHENIRYFDLDLLGMKYAKERAKEFIGTNNIEHYTS